MRKQACLFISIVLFICGKPIAAQQPEKLRYFKTSLGYSFERLRDEGVSNVSLSGSGIFLHAGSEVYTPGRYKRGWDMFMGVGYLRLETPVNRAFALKGYAPSFRLHYRYLRQLWPNWKFAHMQLFGGLVLNNTLDFHLLEQDNNGVSFNNTLLGLMPAVNLQYQLRVFPQRKPLTLNYHLRTQLYSLNARPLFSGLNDPIGASSIHTYIPDKSVGIRKSSSTISELSVDIALRKTNKIRLLYAWYYETNSSNGNTFQNAQHQISISTLFNF